VFYIEACEARGSTCENRIMPPTRKQCACAWDDPSETRESHAKLLCPPHKIKYLTHVANELQTGVNAIQDAQRVLMEHAHRLENAGAAAAPEPP